MSASRLDFIRTECGGNACEQGATFSESLFWEVENPASPGNYIPAIVTGATAKMQVREAAGKPLIVELSTSNTRIVIVEETAEFKLLILPAVTDTLPAGKYKYDLEVTDNSGFITRIAYGTFEIVAQVTV